jgi:hypothetical protein
MRPKYTSRAPALLAIALCAAISACGDKPSQQAGAAPAREIQLPPNAPAQPQLNDAPAASATKPAAKDAQVAKAPTRRAPEPKVVVRPLTAADQASAPASTAAPASAPADAQVAPAPAPAPAPTTGTVSAGTALAVHPVAKVCTNTFKPGDRFTATLSESVSGSNGAVIPAGSSVVLKVDEATRSINSRDSLKLTFSAVSLRIGEQSYDLTGHVSQTAPLERVRVQSTGDQAKKVGAGALIGALAGQLLGKNTRSTVIGGAVGAAAGAAVAAGTADYDGCVSASANLLVNLDQPLRIKLLPN